MALNKEEVFGLASKGKLWAGHLIPNYEFIGEKREIISPIDKSKIGYLALGTKSDVDIAVKEAREAFNIGKWSKLSPAERKKVLLKWARLLEEHQEELAALDCVDAGKPIAECLSTDIPETVNTFNWYAEAIDKCYGRVAPTGDDITALIVKEPVGVVGVVLPWNFPALMYAWKVAPALATGNSVIVKPAELTSLSAYRMTQLAYEAGIPRDVLLLVTGDGESVGAALGRHPDVDMISFTGSTDVGRLFLKYSAESNLKEIVLECGGKSPQVIFDDVVLDEIVDDILNAAFWNMSENCSCGSRLLVHSSIKDELLEKLSLGLKEWKVGCPTELVTKIGPMIEESHFNKVRGFLLEAEEQGAKLFYGGKVYESMGSGWYIEPTIFDNVKRTSKLFREEVFGPILAVTTFETEQEAIELANETMYGLAASLYTLDVRRAQRVAKAIRAGTVSVNGFSEGDITTPFGGYKLSGFGGRDNGLEALDQYQQIKTIWYEN